MQWLIDILAQKVIDEIGIPPVFIDRGDPAATDWTEVDLVQDSAWHDLDLSGIVPAGAKCVLFSLRHLSTNINQDIYLRMKGNVNSQNRAIARTQVANVSFWVDFKCACDVNRFVEYLMTVGGVPTIRLTVRGWWL